MKGGFVSTRHSKHGGLDGLGSTKSAGANVTGSRLNASGDKNPRGKRPKGAMSYAKPSRRGRSSEMPYG